MPRIEENDEENTRDKTSSISISIVEDIEPLCVPQAKVSVSSTAVQTSEEEREEKSCQTENNMQTAGTNLSGGSIGGRVIDWEDPDLDTEATQIQAGFKGMKARSLMQQEEKEIKETIIQKNKEIELNLGIDLTDPEVIRATTKIQAGFRGFHARQLQLIKRPLTPAIFIHKPEDSLSESVGSEFTYTYEDEDEDDLEDEEFSTRPSSPKTAVEDYPFTIGGFRATFGLR